MAAAMEVRCTGMNHKPMLPLVVLDGGGWNMEGARRNSSKMAGKQQGSGWRRALEEVEDNGGVGFVFRRSRRKRKEKSGQLFYLVPISCTKHKCSIWSFMKIKTSTKPPPPNIKETLANEP